MAVVSYLILKGIKLVRRPPPAELCGGPVDLRKMLDRCADPVIDAVPLTMPGANDLIRRQ